LRLGAKSPQLGFELVKKNSVQHTRRQRSLSFIPALASILLAGPVQAVLYHALDLSWQLTGIPDEYRSFCRCQTIPFRSALSTDYALPRLRTKFGELVFSHAGPSAWNSLPEDIRATADSVVFRRQLKTYYFSLTFNVF